MSTLQGLSQGIDEAAESLKALLTVVTAGNGQIETTCATIESDVEAWGRTADDLDSTLANLLELSSGGRERVGTASHGLKGAFAGLQEWAETAEQQLTHVGESFSQLSGELEENVSSAMEAFDSAMALLQESKESLSSQAEQVRGIVESGAQTCAERFGQLTLAVTQGHEKVSGLQAELGSELDTIATEVIGEILSAANQIVDVLNRAMDGPIKSDLTGHFSKLHDAASEAYESFTGVVDEAAQHLLEKVKEAAEELADYCKDEALDQLQTALEDNAQEAVEELITDIAIDMGLISVGSTVTSAMMAPVPILPALSVAEKVLQLVNAALALKDKLGF